MSEPKDAWIEKEFGDDPERLRAGLDCGTIAQSEPHKQANYRAWLSRKDQERNAQAMAAALQAATAAAETAKYSRWTAYAAFATALITLIAVVIEGCRA